jgi:hypothetical protein
MLGVENHVRHIDGGFTLSLALEFLPQLKEPVLNLVFNGGVKFLLPADQLWLGGWDRRDWELR